LHSYGTLTPKIKNKAERNKVKIHQKYKDNMKPSKYKKLQPNLVSLYDFWP